MAESSQTLQVCARLPSSGVFGDSYRISPISISALHWSLLDARNRAPQLRYGVVVITESRGENDLVHCLLVADMLLATLST